MIACATVLYIAKRLAKYVDRKIGNGSETVYNTTLGRAFGQSLSLEYKRVMIEYKKGGLTGEK